LGEQLYTVSHATEMEQGSMHMCMVSSVHDLDALLGSSFGGMACPCVIKVAGESGSRKTVCVFPRAHVMQIDASLCQTLVHCNQ